MIYYNYFTKIMESIKVLLNQRTKIDNEIIKSTTHLHTQQTQIDKKIKKICKKIITDEYTKFLADNNINHKKLLPTWICCDIINRTSTDHRLFFDNVMDRGFSVTFLDDDYDNKINITVQHISTKCNTIMSKKVMLSNKCVYFKYEWTAHDNECAMFYLGEDDPEADDEGYQKKINKIKTDRELKIFVKQFIPKLCILLAKLPQI